MEFKPANEALEEAWYDSFRNLATAAKTAAGDVKKSAGGRVQAAAQTNLQKDISKNLFSMIITAQKLQNSINSTQEFPNKEVLMQNLTNIESELQKNYTILTGRDYTSKAAQPPQPEVSTGPDYATMSPQELLAAAAPQYSQVEKVPAAPQTQIAPSSPQIKKRRVKQANPIQQQRVVDVLKAKRKLNSNEKNQLAALNAQGFTELEESSLKPSFKIKIGETC